MMMNGYISDPVRTAIVRLGGPTKVSNLLGVANGTVQNWIRTEHISNIDHAKKIAELSGIGLEYLRPVR